MVEAGGHGLLTFRRQDLIVVSPGVPLDTPELAQVKNFGLPVIGELELAARFLKGQILAVPAPTARPQPPRCWAKFLQRPACQRWWAATSAFRWSALIDESTDESWSVLEVSSFQLEST